MDIFVYIFPLWFAFLCSSLNVKRNLWLLHRLLQQSSFKMNSLRVSLNHAVCCYYPPSLTWFYCYLRPLFLCLGRWWRWYIKRSCRPSCWSFHDEFSIEMTFNHRMFPRWMLARSIAIDFSGSRVYERGGTNNHRNNDGTKRSSEEQRFRCRLSEPHAIAAACSLYYVIHVCSQRADGVRYVTTTPFICLAVHIRS